ncbi:hypothetical protein F4777DRAFT_593965 [Nemania sp. FL0916]|nr:hypothetical protein F4777DRAFT_593965 [Nemania sp. FL0916]
MAPGGHAPPPTAKPSLPPTPGSSSYTHYDEEPSSSRNKKRAKSIDIDEANQSSIGRLSLYTPTTARNDGPRDLICLCAKAPKVPRPRNAFILYRQAWQGHFAAQHPGLANPEISKLIGEKWREQPESAKNEWKQLAEEEKIRHQRQYPGYRYQPRRGGKNTSGRPTSSNGETPGRCPKCGGRYIATPRTPTTPFSVASPPPSSQPQPQSHSHSHSRRQPPPPQNMQPYTNSEHARHGSISGSSMPRDSAHVGRYVQAPPREVEVDYPPMPSPRAAPPPGAGVPVPPDAKRRRYNGPPVYVPGSPHYAHSVDPRYQHRPSVGGDGPPISATGYGPAPSQLPRPPMPHRQGMYTSSGGHANNPHMQPPPPPSRQSMSSSYQPLATTPSRRSSGFDESLRLPPLQPQVVHDSSSSELSARRDIPPVQAAPGGTGLGITMANTSRQPQHAHAHTHAHGHGHTHGHIPPPLASPSMPQKWSFLLKLEVLRSISPPLRPPPAGHQGFETRGPIIAVEGAPTPVLKEVAGVIERALAVAREFDVRVWSEDTSTAIAHSSAEPHASSSQDHGHGRGGSTGTTTGNNTANHSRNNSSGGAAGDANGAGDGGNKTDKDEKNGSNKDNKNGNTNTGSAKSASDTTVTTTKKPSSSSSSSSTLISPIAGYVARMLKWHKTSEDLIRYITNHPPSPTPPSPPTTSKESDADSGGDTVMTGTGAGNQEPQKTQQQTHKLPVALLSDGYSLTFSDRYAGGLHVHDAYRADDHWQWVATLWRGIVGADLTVYVKRSSSSSLDDPPPGPVCSVGGVGGMGVGGGSGSVEIAGPGVMVVRVLDSGHVDEKLERRLGFEIAEWVRGGSFMAGFGKL